MEQDFDSRLLTIGTNLQTTIVVHFSNKGNDKIIIKYKKKTHTE